MAARATEPADPPPRLDVIDGALQIALAPVQIKQLGLTSAVLIATRFGAERTALGVVNAVTGLLSARAEHLRRSAELLALHAQRALHSTQLARLDQLARAGAAIGPRERYDITLALSDLDARREALAAAQRAAMDALPHTWGDTLAQAAVATVSPIFERLRRGEAFLVRADLGAGAPLNTAPWVAADGQREHALQATVLGAAPIGTRWGGASVWLMVPAALNLPVGAQLTVFIGDDKPAAGVRLPRPAVVWSSGQRWVYREIAAGAYRRIPITAVPMPGDYLFVAQGLRAGDAVVVVGAQSLLAEEQRWAIPDEHDD